MRVKRYDQEKIKSEVLSYLKLNGKSSLLTLKTVFPYSQAFLSRILNSLEDKIFVLGKARETEYAAKRIFDENNLNYPLFEIHENGTTKELGIITPIEPKGFYFSSKSKKILSQYSIDLPYFLNDLRPSGFLGHLVPNQNPELNLPKDIRMWSAEHCLKYLSLKSWDNIGNLIIGNIAFQKYLTKCTKKTVYKGTESTERIKNYELLANDVLSYGEAGSSAGGEQPKFLTTLLPENKPVIVKFSPPINSDIGIRVADLLICEHIALKILNKNGYDSTKSEIIITKDHTFLELERFDRLAEFGRKGLISLGTLDAEFSGVMGTWCETAKALIKLKIIPKEFYEEIRFRELFGYFIANNDMHLFNLSFYTEENEIKKIAPVYDMLPMLFKPTNNQIVKRTFTAPLPYPEDGKIWKNAYKLALQFWENVLNDKNISKSFKKIATDCLHTLNEQREIEKLLPK